MNNKLKINILRQGSVVIDDNDIKESYIDHLTKHYAVIILSTSTKRGDIHGYGYLSPDIEGLGPKITLGTNEYSCKEIHASEHSTEVSFPQFATREHEPGWHICASEWSKQTITIVLNKS